MEVTSTRMRHYAEPRDLRSRDERLVLCLRVSILTCAVLLGAAMLASMVYRLGGGGRPEGWSVGQFVHGVRNLDFFQMMMFVNLIQQVLGGRRGGGYGGGFGGGRRRMFY